MSVQIEYGPVAPNLPTGSIRDGFPGDPTETLARVRRHVSYFGRFRVASARGVVVHDVEADLRRVYTGRREERSVQARGDTLEIGNAQT